MRSYDEVKQAIENIEAAIENIHGVECPSEAVDAYAQLPQRKAEVEILRWVLEGEQPAPLTDTVLAELIELERQATPAPWTAWVGSGKIFYGAADTNKPGNYSPANLQLFSADDDDREDLDTELEGFNIQPGLAENDARFVAALRNASPGLLASLTTAEARAYPEVLTPELDEVLGWPNFKCGPFADAFRAAGYDIPPKAEREQAFILHWLTGLVLKHGAGWKDQASTELAALRDKIAEKEGQQSAESQA